VTQTTVGIMVAGGGGAVVNISSDFGHVGFPGRSVYCATKHGVEGLTKALALELAPLGIRVNSVCPTFIDTPLTRPYFNDADFYRQSIARIPLGRIGRVEEVAAAVLFLSSPASSLVTGASLLVDGGWTAQ
jgi:NAD(P)-dependent dehydrogenase (short-subunit alcohol dehydrogenase family)